MVFYLLVYFSLAYRIIFGYGLKVLIYYCFNLHLIDEIQVSLIYGKYFGGISARI